MHRTFLVLALLGAASLACGGGDEPSEASAGTEPAILQPEDVVTVGTRTIATGPRLSGTLEPAEKAVLRAETAGSIEDVRAEIGDVVKPGQILARIDNSAAGSGFQSARAGMVSAEQQVAIAERELERVKKLVGHGALASRDLELAESQLVAARAQVAGAKAQVAAQGDQLEATVVRSPIAGVVSQRSVGSGDVVSPGSPLFTVIEPSSLRLEAAVPADAASLLKAGATVQFTVQGFRDRPIEGRIERVAPAVDPASRQIPILASIPNADGALVAGLFAEGRVAIDAHEGLVVPADAVDANGPRPYVLRLANGTVERIEVELGLRDEQTESVEITKGVQAGDVLLLGAARDVEPGTPVELRQAEG
jgi:RND family efflux transporter MFP subunit